jgi:hypothetical protein
LGAAHDSRSRKERIPKGKFLGEYETFIEDPGVADKRLFIAESELAGVLKVLTREGSTLSPLMRLAWDGHDLRALTKNSPARATAPLISVAGHITRDEVRRDLDATEKCQRLRESLLVGVCQARPCVAGRRRPRVIRAVWPQLR